MTLQGAILVIDEHVMSIKDNRICTRVQLNSIMNHTLRATYLLSRQNKRRKAFGRLITTITRYKQAEIGRVKSVRRYLRKLLIWNYKHLQVGARNVGQIIIIILCILSCFSRYWKWLEKSEELARLWENKFWRCVLN